MTYKEDQIRKKNLKKQRRSYSKKMISPNEGKKVKLIPHPTVAKTWIEVLDE